MYGTAVYVLCTGWVGVSQGEVRGGWFAVAAACSDGGDGVEEVSLCGR